jgi:hypothetical protein
MGETRIQEKTTLKYFIQATRIQGKDR